MNLGNLREIKNTSEERLSQSASQQKIVMIYAALTLGLMLLVTVTNYVLGMQMDNFGGLSNLGKRTMLSSLQSMLPVVQSLMIMCLDLGYLAAMLRIARGMYTSPQTLRLGFDRFWLLLRCGIFKGLIMTGVTFVSMYLGIMIFVLTPFSKAAVEIIAPIISQVSLLNTEIVIDDVTYGLLMEAMLPAFGICGVLLLILGGPMYYNFRMVNYIIIDKPAIGAMMALRESKKMMKGHRLQLLKLDLSFWWYYLAMGAVMLIGEGPQLFALLGVTIPMGDDAAFILFYSVYLALTFAIYCCLRNRLAVTYALTYDAIKPREPKQEGVVLGNIFQM